MKKDIKEKSNGFFKRIYKKIYDWFIESESEDAYINNSDEEVLNFGSNKHLKQRKSKKIFTRFQVSLLSILMLIFGLTLGCFISYTTDSVTGYQRDQDLEEFISVYNSVQNNYYEDVKSSNLISAALSGMLRALGDEHTYYMDENSTSNFNSTTDGKYTGVGITIQFKDNTTSIVDIFKGSPADKAGLKIGDVICKIGKKDTSKMNSSEIADLIKGGIGDKVSITVKREDKELKFDLTIEEIEIPSVISEIKEVDGQKIGYINIDNFAANTYDQFKKHLKSIEKKGIDSLILDVRDNTGGHLSQVQEVLDVFFKKGTVLYQIESKKSTQKIKAATSSYKDYPVVVLVNGDSASASEVLAACFKENYKGAKIIGTTTYGKGTVQQAFDLLHGTSMKFTTQKWLTPKGNWIHKKGIVPDVEVQNNVETDEDEQMLEAIKILTSKKES